MCAVLMLTAGIQTTGIQTVKASTLDQQIEEALDSPVPAGILASVWLAGILHPDQVSADTYTTEMTNYYETFYGINN